MQHTVQQLIDTTLRKLNTMTAHFKAELRTTGKLSRASRKALDEARTATPLLLAFDGRRSGTAEELVHKIGEIEAILRRAASRAGLEYDSL